MTKNINYNVASDFLERFRGFTEGCFLVSLITK